MLSAYFDLPAATTGTTKQFGRKKSPKVPKPTEASTTTVHVKFEPLPPEKNVPKPAEAPAQAWSAFDETAGTRDDDVALWEDEETRSEASDQTSEPDFEPESLESTVEESLGSSVDDADMATLFGRKRSKPFASPAVAVYSGPQLWYEDEDFD